MNFSSQLSLALPWALGFLAQGPSLHKLFSHYWEHVQRPLGVGVPPVTCFQPSENTSLWGWEAVAKGALGLWSWSLR